MKVKAIKKMPRWQTIFPVIDVPDYRKLQTGVIVDLKIDAAEALIARGFVQKVVEPKKSEKVVKKNGN